MSNQIVEKKSGRIIIIAGPSGVGKTSIVQRLLKEPKRALSISMTTRAKRPDEKANKDYQYITKDEFDDLIQKGWFAEYAEVHSNWYGTPLRPMENALNDGVTLFLDIDVQGAAKIKVRFKDAISFIILPPSLEVLEARLRGRKTEDPKTIERRLSNARIELEEKDKFEHQIVNDNLEEAVNQIEKILKIPHPH